MSSDLVVVFSAVAIFEVLDLLLFILCGNGSVYCMVTGLGQHRPLKPQVMGPIPMLPQTDDNYGQESCSILCLHPLVSSPPILVIADR